MSTHVTCWNNSRKHRLLLDAAIVLTLPRRRQCFTVSTCNTGERTGDITDIPVSILGIAGVDDMRRNPLINVAVTV